MPPILAAIDPYILAFSAATVIATIWVGFWSARRSKTASDFYVAGRSVSVGWNASAISGEYLSAASFMGVAGMVMSSGYDALWYPVCYACGYLFLLLFIAGPLRRFGAYTIPDFAEGRYDSPVFRKIAVVFVLFIGFFYTMPQMKGAGTTLAYIFPGLPYWAGVVLVGAVITLNVALGGMKGITLVQAFQYWAKMFAISVPIFVLMAVYGGYGKQVEKNSSAKRTNLPVMLESLKYAVDYQGPPGFLERAEFNIRSKLRLKMTKLPPFSGKFTTRQYHGTEIPLYQLLSDYGSLVEKRVLRATSLQQMEQIHFTTNVLSSAQFETAVTNALTLAGIILVSDGEHVLRALPADVAKMAFAEVATKNLPEKAPADSAWLSPFGPLTTKAAKATAAAIKTNVTLMSEIPLRPDGAEQKGTFLFRNVPSEQVLKFYGALTERMLLPRENALTEKLDRLLRGQLTRLHLRTPIHFPNALITAQSDQRISAKDMKAMLENAFLTNGITLVAVEDKYFRTVRTAELDAYKADAAGGGREAWLAKHERPLALLYTYSLIIALVCGTAGLPHILVRFYTNPDGVAAKRTTMWVMILIGVFYVFPPVFGVMGRNLLPDLYAGVGAKGTDKIVLELPRLLNEKYAPLGSILSGITCAGAFAAFMSTFSGLLVSMTGALAHDVYGRMLRPKSTPDQRMRAFKICAVILGAVAIGLGMQVEPFQINFMVGQAFAIAAASYFPLLFMSAWWRGMTMKGAAAGMLTGGLLALVGISLTSFSDLKWIDLADFWATHPLWRILCEQPAIWTVPLAITLMVVVSKLTTREVPSDIRMKMLVLHAPEKLGLKQEYIQEHQHGH